MSDPRGDALQIVEDLIEKNKDWWRTESHCKSVMRELGIPDDADAPEVCMGDLYRIQKAIRSTPPTANAPVNDTQRSYRFETDRSGPLPKERIVFSETPASATVPEGWKLVPVEPTDAMMRALEGYYAKWQRIAGKKDDTALKADCWSAYHAYLAMLAAAPSREKGPK